MKTPEGYEKDAVDKYLKSIGAYIVKPTTGGFGASGHADRVCCIRPTPTSRGYFWSLEIKRPGKGPTVLQQKRIDEVRAAGGLAEWGTAERIIGTLTNWAANYVEMSE